MESGQRVPDDEDTDVVGAEFGGTTLVTVEKGVGIATERQPRIADVQAAAGRVAQIADG